MGWWPFSSSGGGALSPAGHAMLQQIEMMDAVFTTAVAECSKKCVSSEYREAEFTKGEAVCVKRCAEKMFQALEVVGAQLTEMGASQAA